MNPPKRSLRCAIYTRKSTEEGLDQAFNSLHAQRESCEAYVRSQAGESWVLIRTIYDDGGYSGGSMDRPALQSLLTEIDGGRVDVVVVYKVDRLTRSLTDFAKIVERFDKRGVSFVSVTQSFNTTTSMGRLTLNVLLSFAQFERELRASASATSFRPPARRACGWAAQSRRDTTFISASLCQTPRKSRRSARSFDGTSNSNQPINSDWSSKPKV